MGREGSKSGDGKLWQHVIKAWETLQYQPSTASTLHAQLCNDQVRQKWGADDIVRVLHMLQKMPTIGVTMASSNQQGGTEPAVVWHLDRD